MPNAIAVYLVRYALHSSPPVQQILKLLCEDHNIHLFLEGVFGPVPAWIRDAPIRIHRVERDQTPSSMPPVHGHFVFDLEGFLLCKRSVPDARPVFYSLELQVPGDTEGNDSAVERAGRMIHDVSALIIQSEERKERFLSGFGCPDHLPVFYLPVTFDVKNGPGRSSYLQERYGIPSDHTLLLHLGETTGKYGAWNLARSVGNLEKTTLVFHGGARPRYLSKLKHRIRDAKIENIVFSEEYCPSFEDMMPILSSADFGIAWYNGTSINMRSAGWSSAKIASYYSCGVPVIGNRTRSMIEVIDDPDCGVTVKHPSDIPSVLPALRAKRERQSANCLERVNTTYRFATYEQPCRTFLNEHVFASGS